MLACSFIVILKLGSQYDASPCVALHGACETWKYSNFHDFYDKTQERNAKECKDRIRVYPCVALRRASMQRWRNVMQALASYCEPGLRHFWMGLSYFTWACTLTPAILYIVRGQSPLHTLRPPLPLCTIHSLHTITKIEKWSSWVWTSS